MNRSLRRQKHNQFLSDVLHGVSVPYVWRERIVVAQGRRIPISAATPEGLYPRLLEALQRWGLEYTVRVVPPGKIRDWKGCEGQIRFEVAAREFPSLRIHSWNPPNAIVEDEGRSQALVEALPYELWWDRDGWFKASCGPVDRSTTV